MRLTLTAPWLLLAVGGCFPAVSVEQPAIVGRVVDGEGRPVDAASVVVRADGTGPVVASTHTDASGSFSQPAGEGRWFIYFLPQDNPPPPTFGVEVSSGVASGKAADVGGGQIKPFGLGFDRTVDAGTVRLR